MNKPTSIAYIDLLSALVAIFVVLFALVVSQQNQQSQGNVDEKAEFIIQMSWPDDSLSDVDLWAANPSGDIVYFRHKDLGLMTLNRDNLGNSKNKIIGANGEEITDRSRNEMISIRGHSPGTYTCNVVLWGLRGRDTEVPVKVQIFKLNPYQIVAEKEVLLTKEGQEITIAEFTVDEANNVLTVDTNKQVSLLKGVGL